MQVYKTKTTSINGIYKKDKIWIKPKIIHWHINYINYLFPSKCFEVTFHLWFHFTTPLFLLLPATVPILCKFWGKEGDGEGPDQCGGSTDKKPYPPCSNPAGILLTQTWVCSEHTVKYFTCITVVNINTFVCLACNHGITDVTVLNWFLNIYWLIALNLVSSIWRVVADLPNLTFKKSWFVNFWDRRFYVQMFLCYNQSKV